MEENEYFFTLNPYLTKQQLVLGRGELKNQIRLGQRFSTTGGLETRIPR